MTIAFDNSFRVSFRPLPELTPNLQKPLASMIVEQLG